MLTTRSVLTSFSAAVMVLAAAGVSGQTTSTGSGQAYPSKPIRVVTSSAGGGSDFAARFIAQGIAGPLGQQVLVENRPSGVIPGQVVSQAPPDGYTLLLGSTSLWIGPLLRKTPYDTVRDFAPVSTVSIAPLILVVHPSLPVKSVKELITLAKARPGDLNYGTGSIGSSTHLAMELLKSITGVNIVRISYASGEQEIPDLIGGQVHMKFSSGSQVLPFVKLGKLRTLAVTSAQPSVLYPGVPTVAATGAPGYEFVGVDGILAPAKTPDAILKRLSQEMVRFLSTAEAKERVLTVAGGEAVGSSPEEFAARIKSEISKMTKVIKDADIKVE